MLPQENQNRILTTLALGLFFYEYENVTAKHFLKDKNNEWQIHFDIWQN